MFLLSKECMDLHPNHLLYIRFPEMRIVTSKGSLSADNIRESSSGDFWVDIIFISLPRHKKRTIPKYHMWWSSLVCFIYLILYFPVITMNLKPPFGKNIHFFPTMTQVKNCSHSVRQDIVTHDISFLKRTVVMGQGVGYQCLLQRRLDLIETRRVEEVTELLQLAQKLLLCPDALKKFCEMNQEYMICGRRYVWLDWMSLWNMNTYIYIYTRHIFLHSLVVIHEQLNAWRWSLCADSNSSGGWHLQKYWPRQIENDAELVCAWWGQGLIDHQC